MNLKPLGRTRKAPHQLTSCSLLSPWSFEPGSGGSSGCWCYAVCWFPLFLLATSQAGAKALVRKNHNLLAVLLSSAKTMRQGSHFKVEHGVMSEHQDPSGWSFLTFTPASTAGSRSHISHCACVPLILILILILQTLKLDPYHQWKRDTFRHDLWFKTGIIPSPRLASKTKRLNISRPKVLKKNL